MIMWFEGKFRLLYFDKESKFRIFLDTETKVQYIIAPHSYGYGITPRLDTNGKPLLWDGE